MIRPEQPSDEAAIRIVLKSSFGQTGEGRLVEALRAAGRLAVSLVAEEAGQIVGQVAFSPVTVAGIAGGLGLRPLAVRSARQRQGFGQRLVREGLAVCRQAGVGFVVVLGAPAYYRQFGFVTAANFGLIDEYGGGLAFQSLELTVGAIPKPGGLVQYAPEFALVAGDSSHQARSVSEGLLQVLHRIAVSFVYSSG